MNQDRTSETIRVLSPVVRMIPVSARLVYLFRVSALTVFCLEKLLP